MRKEVHTNAYESYKKIAAYINGVDVFWLAELRSLLGCQDSDCYNNIANSHISGFIERLRKLGFIQCSEVSNGNRQYIRVKNIPDVKDLFERKKHLV